MISSYRDLTVWRKAMALVKETYTIARELPREELYALSSQLRRSAVSIPSNIAEGQARCSTREFINFLSMARGSNAELQTQLLLSVQLSFVSDEQIQKAMRLSDEVGRMLNALINKLNARL